MMNEKEMELAERVEKILNLPEGSAKYQTLNFLLEGLVEVIENDRAN